MPDARAAMSRPRRSRPVRQCWEAQRPRSAGRAGRSGAAQAVPGCRERRWQEEDAQASVGLHKVIAPVPDGRVASTQGGDRAGVPCQVECTNWPSDIGIVNCKAIIEAAHSPAYRVHVHHDVDILFCRGHSGPESCLNSFGKSLGAKDASTRSAHANSDSAQFGSSLCSQRDSSTNTFSLSRMRSAAS